MCWDQPIKPIQPACPGATGCGYTTVFTAYECLTFHHRTLTYQVWARGLGQGIKIKTKLVNPASGAPEGHYVHSIGNPIS